MGESKLGSSAKDCGGLPEIDDQGGNFRPFFTPAEPPSERLLPASLQVINRVTESKSENLCEGLRRADWDAVLGT
jgi:hypothetical protein